MNVRVRLKHVAKTVCLFAKSVHLGIRNTKVTGLLAVMS